MHDPRQDALPRAHWYHPGELVVVARVPRERAVKNAVEVVHRQLDSLSADGVEVLGAMPHWHLRAHEGSVGGSPGSRPRPVYPDQVPAGWTYRYYQPVNPRFDLRQANDASDGA